jgi:hypothetical protein
MARECLFRKTIAFVTSCQARYVGERYSHRLHGGAQSFTATISDLSIGCVVVRAAWP